MSTCICESDNSVQVLDPFDTTGLRLSSDFAANLGVKKALMTVPVRKPAREWWVQVCPDEAYRVQTCVVDLKEDREIYLVKQSLWPELAGESTFGPKALFTAVNRQGVLFLWPARLPGADGKTAIGAESAFLKPSDSGFWQLDSRCLEHEPQCLRGLRDTSRMARAAMAKRIVVGPAPRCVQEQAHREP